MDLYQELSKLPNRGVYGFFNNKEKRCHICYSVNILNALPQVINKLNCSNKIFKADSDQIQFRMIEPIHQPDALRLRYAYWVKFYKQLGYTLYKEPRVCSYKLRIEVLNEVLGRGTGKYHFYVKLVSRGYKELIVGVFDNISEMDIFISTNYKEINNVVYCSNKLTNEFLANVSY